MNSKPKLLVIGKVWPEPNSSAAGTRILQIMSIFKQKGYSITFSSAAKRSEYSTNLVDLGIFEKEIELNSSTFESFIDILSPDVVLYDRYMTEEQFGWRVTNQLPNAIQLLDTEDLHFLRRARELCLNDGKNTITEFYSYLKNEIMVRELASMLRCDFSIMISEFEIQLLKDEFNFQQSKLLYLPLLIPDDDIETVLATPDFGQRNHFVTIGNFLHKPNWDSVLYLKEVVWPDIRKLLPKAEIHIYGAYPDQKVWNLHNEASGFIIKGRVENIQETLHNYRIMLAPLRFGAGQKGKLLDAKQAGLPSVTTLIGIEGMGIESNWPGIVCSDGKSLIHNAVLLYSDEKMWQVKKSSIYPQLSNSYKFSKFSTDFWVDLDKKFKHFQEIRQKNYLSEMMRYQSNNASKFMGKWIEEKNKKKS